MGHVLKLDPERVETIIIQRSADVLTAGGVLLYPTETLYGLGCDVYNGSAIERIFNMKQRPEGKPFLLLVQHAKMLKTIVDEIPPEALRLIEAFWPGPLTILFPAKNTLHRMLIGKNGKVGVRVPASTYCRKLLTLHGRPIVSTSANLSGEVAVPSIEELKQRFRDSVDLIIDGGTLPSQRPSTVVDVMETGWKIIREGCIPAGDIESVLQH